MQTSVSIFLSILMSEYTKKHRIKQGGGLQRHVRSRQHASGRKVELLEEGKKQKQNDAERRYNGRIVCAARADRGQLGQNKSENSQGDSTVQKTKVVTGILSGHRRATKQSMKEKIMRFCLIIAAFALLPLTTSDAQSVHILQHAILGNSTEDITFVGNGPLAGQVAIMDGYVVRGLLPKSAAAHALFDVRRLGIGIAPRGLTYVNSSHLFALNDGIQRTKLFLANDHGQPKGTRTIRYLNGYLPDFLEGLGYISENATSFPDHILLSTIIFSPQASRIEVLRKDGTVVAEILPAEPLGSSYITGVSYLAPDHILVSSGNGIWEIDFAGNILAGPITLYGVGDIEGLAQLSNGNIVAADHDAGKIFFFDKNLNRLPSKDRSYKVGIGVSTPDGAAWNTDTNQHLIGHAPTVQATEIVSIPPTLDSATQVVDLARYGFDAIQRLSYLSDEHLIAAAIRYSPHAIVLFDNSGNLVQQIDVSAIGSPRAIAYIPTTKQFAVGFFQAPLQVSILDRNGTLVRTIDLSSMGISRVDGLTFFDPADPSGGKFLLVVNDATQVFRRFAMVIDFNGNLRRKFDVRKTFGFLEANDVGTISTGPQNGAFSMVDSGGSEIAIFRFQ